MNLFGLDPVMNDHEFNWVKPDQSPMRARTRNPHRNPNCMCEEPTGDPGPSICGFFYCTTCGGTVI